MSILSVTVVILTYNEEIHIERCIRSLQEIAEKIFIVDSFSTDKTVEIARSLGAEIRQRSWKNYSDQFQWGLDNCNSNSVWMMRMDADEYLEPKLQREIQDVLPNLHDNICGVYINRKVFFHDKWMKHGGTYPQTLLRIWRNGKGRIEHRWMDEHITLPVGSNTILLKKALVDDNQKGISFWIDKCNSYSSREMVDLLNNKYHLYPQDDSIKNAENQQAKWKRLLKNRVYSNLPVGLRSALYFMYRYLFRLGFLDGRKGFLWHFMQGFWYRLLVDVKIIEIEKRCRGDIEKMKLVLSDEYGIKL